jgi:hypothetical protein
MKVAGSYSQIRRDLQGISSDLKWSSVELSRIAGRLEAAGNSADAQAIQRMMQIFQEGEVRLNHIAGMVSDENLVTQAAG